MRQDLPKTSFTNKNIALANPGRHQITGAKGLYLYVSPQGDVRRWLYRYTSPQSKRVTETGLGPWPVVALTDAKTKADDLRQQVAQGICPIHAKRQERSACITFKEAADGWIETHKPSWRGQSQQNNARVLLHLHGAPLANVPVKDITPDKIQSALTELWAKHPAQARNALGMWERVLDYARAKGFRTGDNPASWKGCHEYRFPRQKRTDRNHYAAMHYDQVPEFIKGLQQRQERSSGASALEFVILTACRAGEALGATWDEFDFENRVWTQSPDRTKQGREHTVPLSNRVMEILALQKRYANGSPYVFNGYHGNKIDDKAMRSTLHYMKADVTVHGFRSSFRNWAGDMTMFQREAIEETLGHVVGGAVERAYRRQSGLDKRRVILEAWAEYCAGDGLVNDHSRAA